MMAAMGQQGLRTMRIHLSELFRRDLFKKRGAAESLRARRQANQTHVQGPAPGAWHAVGAGGRDSDACRCYGCAGRRAGFFTHESRRATDEAIALVAGPRRSGRYEQDVY